jgi:aspartokinase
MRGGVVACGVPRSLPVVVLKFGSSVLSQPEGYRRAADEVRKEVACRKRVVAVVSAMGSTTDRLLEAARSLAPTTEMGPCHRNPKTCVSSRHGVGCRGVAAQ